MTLSLGRTPGLPNEGLQGEPDRETSSAKSDLSKAYRRDTPERRGLETGRALAGDTAQKGEQMAQDTRYALLEEARQIARGETMKAGTTEHVTAMYEYAELLQRTISMAVLGAHRDMDRMDAWATAKEAEQRQKASV